MKLLFPIAVAIATLSLVACTEGGDVYVSEPGKSPTTSSALECTVVPGAKMCERTLDSVAQAERPKVLDTLQAVADFAEVSASTTSEIEAACRGIVDETSGTLPSIPNASTPEARLDIVCLAAHDRIVAAERGVLTIDVVPATCPKAIARTCSAPANVGTPACAPAAVTVSTTDGASAITAAVGVALSHHYAAFMGVKGRLETLAAISAQLTGNADSLGLLPEECAVSASTLIADAQGRVGAALEAANLVADATNTLSR